MAGVDAFFQVRERRQKLQGELAQWGDKYQELGQVLQRWPSLVLFHQGGRSLEPIPADLSPKIKANISAKVKPFNVEDFQRIMEIARLVQEYRQVHLEELRTYRELPLSVRSSIAAPPSLW